MRNTLGISLPLNPHLAAVALVRALGGVGSGNFGHEGRPGEVGGSGDDGGKTTSKDGTKALKQYVTGLEGSGRGDANAQDVNFLLRDSATKFDPGMKSQIHAMDASMRPLQSDTTLYRLLPVKYVDRLKVGDVFSDKGFISTTSNRNALEDIFDEIGLGSHKTTATLEISVPKGTKHIDVNKILGRHIFAHQSEMILARGSRFVVKSRSGNNLKIAVLHD